MYEMDVHGDYRWTDYWLERPDCWWYFEVVLLLLLLLLLLLEVVEELLLEVKLLLLEVLSLLLVALAAIGLNRVVVCAKREMRARRRRKRPQDPSESPPSLNGPINGRRTIVGSLWSSPI